MTGWRVRAAAAALPALGAAPAAAQQGYGGVGAHGWDGAMWMMPFAGLLWLVAVAAVVVGAVLLVRLLWHATPGGRDARAGRAEALDLLDKRYAAGEIDREDYLRRKEDLQR